MSDHRPTQPLSAEQLAEIAKWPTPAIANAIETFNIRSRATGFMSSEIVGRFPELGVSVGYAVTSKIRASIPPADDPETVDRDTWVEHILSVPGPRFVVMQEMDQPAVGSYWGEVNATRHKAMECVGIITDGGVRDLDEMRGMGFNALSKAVLVSHAYTHLVDVGGPVTVGGLTVHPGDLLAGDQHGVIHIPHEIAAEVAAAAQRVEDEERKIIQFYRSPDYRPGDRDGGRYPLVRAVVVHDWTDLDGLAIEELPAPHPGPGEVSIEVHAAGVNFADLLIVKGEYQHKPPFPFAPGMEAAGTIRALGEGVTGLQVGQRVLAMLDSGGYAEEVVARAHEVTPIPESMDFETAATFPIVYATSHLALGHRARLEPGEVLLVHGASGGVGLTAVEIGKAMGATVIASASSAEKLHVALEHGADFVINYAEEDIRQRVLDLTGGADVVYDPVGGDAFTASLRCINPGGRILIIGFASGTIPQIPANHLLVKDAAALGFSVNQLRRNNPEAVQAAMRELLAWVADGRLKPLVSSVVPFEEFQDAMRLLRDRRSTGKVAIRVR